MPLRLAEDPEKILHLVNIMQATSITYFLLLDIFIHSIQWNFPIDEHTRNYSLTVFYKLFPITKLTVLEIRLWYAVIQEIIK